MILPVIICLYYLLESVFVVAYLDTVYFGVTQWQETLYRLDLTTNISVGDGLVNGAMGVIRHLLPQKHETFTLFGLPLTMLTLAKIKEKHMVHCTRIMWLFIIHGHLSLQFTKNGKQELEGTGNFVWCPGFNFH